MMHTAANPDTKSLPANHADSNFWLMFEQAAAGIALVSLHGQYLRANPELCRVLGYTEEQFCTFSPQDITHPDDAQRDINLQAQLIAGEISTYRIESRYIRRDRSLAWFFTSVSLARDAAGVPLHFILLMQDITARKQAQDELEQARKRYQAVYDNVEDFISVNDVRGNYIFASRAAGILLGYEPGELLGTNIFRYIHPHDHEVVYEAYKKFSTGSHKHLRIRYRAFRKDGTYTWVETYAQPLSSTTGAEPEIVCVSRSVQDQQPSLNTSSFERVMFETGSLRLQEDTPLDQLTHLAGRQASDELLGSKLVSPRSANFPFGVLLVDIDNFRGLNAKYGAEIGDEIVRRVAAVLRDSCRMEDSIARYGGDEFMIILPSTNPGGTIIVGEKLNRNVRTIDWSDTPITEGVTVSIGAACITLGNSFTLPELMGIIELQLEQAREGGGDCLIMNTRQTAQRTGKL